MPAATGWSHGPRPPSPTLARSSASRRPVQIRKVVCMEQSPPFQRANLFTVGHWHPHHPRPSWWPARMGCRCVSCGSLFLLSLNRTNVGTPRYQSCLDHQKSSSNAEFNRSRKVRKLSPITKQKSRQLVCLPPSYALGDGASLIQERVRGRSAAPTSNYRFFFFA